MASVPLNSYPIFLNKIEKKVGMTHSKIIDVKLGGELYKSLQALSLRAS